MKTQPSPALDAQRLRSARERAQLTQTEVSQRLKMSRGACGEWERGTRSPSLEKFVELCKLLRVSADHLLALEPGAADSHGDAASASHGRHEPAASPDTILADDSYPDGLRALADSLSHQAALRITPPEWAALASLDLPGGLTREGYIGLLVLLRAAPAQRIYAPNTPAPSPFADEHLKPRTTGVSDDPVTVHEPRGPGYRRR